MIAKLKENGYKITPQRLAILKILSTSIGHPTINDIYKQIKHLFPTISLATVYKNISVMKDLNEVLELSFSEESNRYDGNYPFPHPHAICMKCKKIMDCQLENIQDFTQKIIEETGFNIINHRIDFFGICPDCLKKKNN